MKEIEAMDIGQLSARASLNSVPQPSEIILKEYNREGTVDYSVRDTAVTVVGSSGQQLESSKDLRNRLKSLILPEGYPYSVSKDYGEYRKWTGLQNILSSAVNYFNTQALLTALGVSFPAPAIAAVAWTAKETISGIGKLIGGHFAGKVDQNPKEWNNIADAVTQAGNMVGNTLAIVPGAFLPVSIAGQTLRAAGETLSCAAQANFDKSMAISGNIGEMSAKNSNQDMITSAVGSGLAMGLQALASMSGVGPAAVVAIYAGISALSLYGSYRASKAVNLDAPNESNLMRLFNHHAETGNIISPKDLEDRTPFLKRITDALSKKIALGAGLDGLMKSPEKLKDHCSLFSGKNYLIYRDEKDRTNIVLRREADKKDTLEAVYCASLFEKAVSSPSYDMLRNQLGDEHAELSALRQSIDRLPKDGSYMEEISKSGWDMDKFELPNDRRYDWSIPQ